MNPQLTLALAALSQQITGLSSAVTLLAQTQGQKAKAAPAGGGAAPGATVLETVFSAATGRIMLLLAPVVGLAAVIQQTASGFSAFSGALRVVTATIAPLLLPVFAVLAAAVLAVSDEIWDALLPNLKAWYVFVLSNMIPALVEFVQAVRDAADFLRRFAKDPAGETARAIAEPAARAAEEAGWNNSIPGRFGGWLGMKLLEAHGLAEPKPGPGKGSVELQPGDPTLEQKWRERAARQRREMQQSPPPAGAGGGFSGGGDWGDPNAPAPKAARPPVADRFMGALRDVIQSIRQQAGPPASMLTPESINRQAQLASANADPLERRVRDRLLTSLDLLDKAVSEIAENTKPRPDGLFEGQK
jgi:hypothetical protein